MTVLREAQRFRLPSPSNDWSFVRRIQQICAISTIVIVMLRSTTKNSSRASFIPLVSSFTLHVFKDHALAPHSQRLWFSQRHESLNAHANTDTPQRFHTTPRHHPNRIIPAMSATIITSSSDTAETNLWPTNQSSNALNGSTTQPKMIESKGIWNSYSVLANSVIRREFDYFKHGLQPEQLTIVEGYLLQNHWIPHIQRIDLSSESRDTIRDQLNEQKRLFLDVTNFTPPMYKLYCRCLMYVNDNSARQQVRSPALPSWYKLLECGLCPRENTISTCLYVLSMQPRDSVPSPLSSHQIQSQRRDETLFKQASLHVAIFHDLLYQSNEKTALVRIKKHIADHNASAAEEVLHTLSIKTQETNGPEDTMSWKRLRTYQPIFQYYCDIGNLIDAFRIYRDMQRTSGVYLIGETYALLIGTAAKYGWFRTDHEMSNNISSSRSKAMKQLKFRSSRGPELLDELFSEMSRDVLELDESCAGMLMDGFNVGFDESKPKSRFFSFLSSLINVQPNEVQNNRHVFFQRVAIDNTTALCPASGAKLRLLTLSKQQIRNVHDSLIQMAESEQERFGERGNTSNRRKKTDMTNDTNNNTALMKLSKKMTISESRNATHASKELSLFSDWLRYRTGEPFTAIIDGPNVAYYGHCDVQWSQVKRLLDKLEGMGENPLVIMPQKYISPRFKISSDWRMQDLSQSDLAFINQLVAAKKIYVVPSSCLDDYYWMLSSVAEQGSGSSFVPQHVPTDDITGRFPGLRPLLVTNDQMRDHRLELLEPRLFRRWASCHIVKYHIEPLDESVNSEEGVTLFPADFFSREIQCNKAPRFSDSTAWHIPIAEWPEPERLCISVMR